MHTGTAIALCVKVYLSGVEFLFKELKLYLVLNKRTIVHFYKIAL